MLSLEEWKRILNSNGENTYTDDEVKKIRELLYQLARLVKEQIDFEKIIKPAKSSATKDTDAEMK